MSNEMSFVPVKDVMNTEPVLIDGMATVGDALKRMRERGLRALVVKRRDERDEFGLLLLNDIARKVLSENRSLERTNVYEIMQKPAPSVEADMNIRYAVRHMTHYGLSHCVVLHGRELSGVVTLHDMTLRYAEL